MFTADAENGFDKFWLTYPRKQGKLDAVKAWSKLNPDKTLQAQIIAAVKESRETDAWRKEAGKFIPLPATYLNGRRWEDEPITAGNAAPWNEI